MSSQPSSPIPLEPNLPTTMTTVPSDLFSQIRATQIEKMMDRIFNDSVLPDYWSTETKKLTRSSMENMIALQDRLMMKLEETKWFIQMSPLPTDRLFGLIQNLTQAVDMYERAMISASNCRRYLPKES